MSEQYPSHDSREDGNDDIEIITHHEKLLESIEEVLAQKEETVLETSNQEQDTQLKTHQRESTDQKNRSKNKLSRRNFLKMAGATAGAVALGTGGKIVHEQFLKDEKLKIFERTGLDIGAVAERNGFDTDLQVDIGKGRYMLHIGQTHDIGEITLMSKKIYHSQRNIESLIKDLIAQDENFKYVYDEGLTDELGMKLLAYMKEYKKFFDRHQPSPKVFGELLDEYMTIRDDFKAKGLDQKLPVSKYIGYFFINKIHQLKDYYQDNKVDYINDESFQKDVNNVADIQEIILTNHNIIDSDPKNMRYILGGAVAMYLDGEITLRASETLKGNAKASIANREYKKVLMESDDINDKKVIEARKKFQEAQTDRDVIAVEKVAESEQKIVPIVYGANHEFKDEVKKHNKKGEQRMGLIKLTSKKDIFDL